MSLSSTSTIEQVWAAYENNADYDAQASVAAGVAKARLFVQACRILVLRNPRKMAHGGASAELIEYDTTQIRTELNRASSWLSTYGGSGGGAGTPGVTVADMTNFRRGG